MKVDYLVWAAMFIAFVALFWNVDTGFNHVHERIDRLQAETTARFEALQAETNRRFDQAQVESNRRFEAVDRRFDMILEAIMSFDRRVSRNEGQVEVIREQLQAEGAP